MKVSTLLKRFKASRRRLSTAVKGYKKLIRSAYFLQNDGSFMPLAEIALDRLGKLDTGAFEELRRQHRDNVTLYRFGRDGKPYVKPYDYCYCGNRKHGTTQCDFCNGQSCSDYGEFFCRDFQVCLDYEAAIGAAMADCAQYQRELENAGIDPWTDDDLWK